MPVSGASVFAAASLGVVIWARLPLQWSYDAYLRLTHGEELEEPTFERLQSDAGVKAPESLRAPLEWHVARLWPKLRPSARLNLRRLLVRKLQIRHRVLSDPPPASAPELERPVFLIGLPRVGSTLFHQLMAQQPCVRALERWELLRAPDQGAGPREECDDYWAEKAGHDWRLRLNAKVAGVHAPASHEADECHLGYLEMCFVELQRHYDGTPLHDWYDDKDHSEQFGNYRRLLEYVLHRRPGNAGSFFVGKTPWHLFTLEPLSDAFPGARFVWIHRDPAAVVRSFMGLAEAMRLEEFGVASDPEVLRDAIRRKLAKSVRLGLEARKRLEARGVLFLDVQYEDLMADPQATVAGVLRWLGRESDAATATVQVPPFSSRTKSMFPTRESDRDAFPDGFA